MRPSKDKITPLSLDLPEEGLAELSGEPEAAPVTIQKPTEQGPGGLSAGVDLGLIEPGKSGNLGRLNTPYQP